MFTPRKIRLQYPGAIYHVMSGGNRWADIFFDDVDRQDFIKTLAEACAKTAFQVHAFSLMSNHFLLVLETPQANLVAGMQWLLSSYTLRLNRRRALVTSSADATRPSWWTAAVLAISKPGQVSVLTIET